MPVAILDEPTKNRIDFTPDPKISFTPDPPTGPALVSPPHDEESDATTPVPESRVAPITSTATRMALSPRLGRVAPRGKVVAFVPETKEPTESLLGLTPELIPPGTGPATSLLSAGGKAAVGAAAYMTSRQGLLEAGVAATPAAPAVFTKWAYDMIKGGVASVKDAAEEVGSMIRDSLNRQIIRKNQLGIPEEATKEETQGHVQRLAEDAVNAAVGIFGGVGAGLHAGRGVGGLIKPSPLEFKADAIAPVAPATSEALKQTAQSLQQRYEAVHGRAPTPEELRQVESGQIELPQFIEQAKAETPAAKIAPATAAASEAATRLREAMKVKEPVGPVKPQPKEPSAIQKPSPVEEVPSRERPELGLQQVGAREQELQVPADAREQKAPPEQGHEVGTPADKFGAVYGPNVGKYGYEKLRQLSDTFEPQELPSPFPSVRQTLEVRNGKLWLTTQQITKGPYKPQAVTYLHVKPDGETVMGGSFTYAGFEQPVLAKLGKKTLADYISKWASEKPTVEKPAKVEPTAIEAPQPERKEEVVAKGVQPQAQQSQVPLTGDVWENLGSLRKSIEGKGWSIITRGEDVLLGPKLEAFSKLEKGMDPRLSITPESQLPPDVLSLLEKYRSEWNRARGSTETPTATETTPRPPGVNPTATEWIEAAAYQDEQGTHTGPHHPAALEQAGGKELAEKFPTRESRNQPQFGYRTNLRSFVSRSEAAPIAEKSGQKLEAFDVDEQGQPAPHSDQVASPVEPGKALGEVAQETKTEPISEPTPPAAPERGRSVKGAEPGVESVKLKPLNMAGQVRPERPKPTPAPSFESLHPNSIAKFNSAWDNRDPKAMGDLLSLMNRGLRAEFERRSGTKLPKTVGGTKQAIETWAKAEPQAPPPSDVPPGQSALAREPTEKVTPAAETVKRVARGYGGLRKFHAETEAFGPDILSWIQENMKLLSKSQAKKLWGKEKFELNKSLWDDVVKLESPHHNLIYGDKGYAPDRVAQAAYEAGVLKEPSVNLLWKEIERSSKSRASAFATSKREARFMEEESKAHEDWLNATAEGETRVAGGDLKVGDLMEVEGERVEVTNINPDTGDVTLKDGRKFGTQVIGENKVIHVEKFEPSEEGGFETEAQTVGVGETALGAKATVETAPPEPPKELRLGQAPNSDNLNPDPKRAELKQLADNDPGVVDATLKLAEVNPQAKRLFDAVANGGRVVKRGSRIFVLDKRSQIVGHIDPATGGLSVFEDVPLEQLERGETQERGMPQDMSKVDRYAALTSKPPVIAAHGPRFEGDTYQIINGHHRFLAAKKRGDKTIRTDSSVVSKDGSWIHVAQAGQESGIPDFMARFKAAVEEYKRRQSEAPQKPTFEEHTAALRAKEDELIARNMAKVPEDATAIRLQNPEGKFAVVTKDPTEPGKWRLTYFTSKGEPWGHGVLDTRDEAIQSGLGIYGKKYGPPHLPKGYEVVEATKPEVTKPTPKPGGELFGPEETPFNLMGERASRPTPTKGTETAQGELLGAPPEAAPVEPLPKPAIQERPLTKAEQKEFRGLSIKARDNRESGGPPLTSEESQRYNYLTAIAGQKEFPEIRGMGGAVPSEAPPKTHAEQAKAIADRLREQFKTETGGGQVFTGPVEIINAAVEVAAKIIEAGGKFADAIEAAIKYFREHHDNEADRAEFESKMREWLKGEEPKTPPKPEATSLKNAVAELEREGLGLEQAPPTQVKNMAEAWMRSGEVLEKDATSGAALADQLIRNPERGITDDESALLLRHKRQMYNALNDAAEKTVSGDPESKAEAQITYARLSDEFQTLLNAIKERGTQWGREGRWRQALAYEDYSFATQERLARAAKGGEPLTDIERETLLKDIKEREAVAAALEKRLADREKLIADREVKLALDRVELEAKKQPIVEPHVRIIADKIKDYFGKRADAALKRLSGKLFTISPQVLADLTDLGVSTILKGAIEFGEWGAKMVALTHESLKPHLQMIWDRAQAALNAHVEKVAGPKKSEKVKRAVKGTDIAEQKSDLTEKISGKLESKTFDEVSPLVQKLARLFVEEGVRGRDNLIDAVHGVLKEIDPEITRDEAMDAISGYGKFKRLKKDPTSVLLRGYKGEMQQVAKLRDMAAGKDPFKTGLERRSPNDEERRLIKLVNEEKKKGGYEVTDQEIQLATAEMTRLTYYRNRLVDLQQEISTRQKLIKERREPPTNPEIEALKAQYQTMKAERDALFNTALDGFKKRTQKRIDFLQAKLDSGNVDPSPRKPPLVLDPEALRLQQKKVAIEQKIFNARRANELKAREWWEKGADAFVKWKRAFVLSSLGILRKLTAAAQIRSVLMPVEDIIGAGYARLPGISKIAAKAPIEGQGTSISLESEAKVAGWTKGMKDAWDKLRTGQMELDIIHGKRRLGFEGESTYLEPHFLNYIAFSHGALKAQIFRESYTRALRKLYTWNAKQGIDVTDPITELRLSNLAYKWAERQIFLQDNAIVDGYKRFLSRLEQKDKTTGKPNPSLKLLASAIRAELPIIKVPTNIVGESIEYLTGAITGNLKAANALRKGVESLPEQEAELIMRQVKKGTLGLPVAILVGYLLRNQIGGFYLPERKKKGEETIKPGEMKIGDYTVPETDIHAPFFTAIMYGATVGKAADHKIRKSDEEPQGVMNGIIAANLGLAEMTPFYRSAIDAVALREPSQRSRILGQRIQSELVPGAVRWTASHFDTDESGHPIKRDPKTMLDWLEMGVPGLRQQVPEKRK